MEVYIEATFISWAVIIVVLSLILIRLFVSGLREEGSSADFSDGCLHLVQQYHLAVSGEGAD
jgi:hypothetical protein